MPDEMIGFILILTSPYEYEFFHAVFNRPVLGPYSTTPFRVFNGKRRNNGRHQVGEGIHEKTPKNVK
jgi:hypothetical protein